MDKQNFSFKNYFINYKKQFLFTLFLFFAFATWTGLIIARQNFHVDADEKYHLRQIQRFTKGNFNLLSELTNIPGYHLTIAAIASPVNHPSSTQIKFISLLLSLFSIWAFYSLAKKNNSGDPLLRTIQFVFLPISFFYYPFIYVDIFSLFLVLISFYFALSGRSKLSALFALFSLAVRQNNIVWIVFTWTYVYLKDHGFVLTKEKTISHLKNSKGMVMVFIIFLLFLFINKGIALGDKENQQLGFYAGNLYFFLFLIAIIFIPALIASLLRFKQTLTNKSFFSALFFGGAIAGVFLLFPPDLHEYNLSMDYLRNVFLSFVYNGHAALYALTIFLGVATLFSMKFDKNDLIVFLFIFCSLSPSFLVEQRYAIVPITFILLFRKHLSILAESALVIYFMFLSAIPIYAYLNLGLFF